MIFDRIEFCAENSSVMFVSITQSSFAHHRLLAGTKGTDFRKDEFLNSFSSNSLIETDPEGDKCL